MNDTPVELDRRLSQSARPYELVGAGTPDEARIRFTGMFEGRAVIWDATVRRNPDPRDAQYFEIGEPAGDTVAIAIGLHVPALDAPTLHKIVVMVRHYRRLRRGRHEFGSAAAFTEPQEPGAVPANRPGGGSENH